MDLKGKTALVVGLAKSGVAAARLLRKLGATVLVTDKSASARSSPMRKLLPRGTEMEAGAETFFDRAIDLIVVSPGVPWNHPRLTAARRHGIPVWPELELGWRNVKPAKTVAVTGTNGKTTTTALIGHLLKSAGKSVLLGGNIGTPLSALAGRVKESTCLVLEVSSYQLEGHETFHPDVALFLNLTPDHLARHGTMAGYAKAKARIFENQGRGDTAVLNAADPWCRRVARGVRGKKVLFPSATLERLAGAIRLPGRHNLENAMAASAAAMALGISERAISRGLATFKGVAHRIQTVATKHGVTFVNDSKSTNVDSTSVALKSFEQPLWLILGGQHKGAPYTPLAGLVRRHVREILTIGEAAPLIRRDLGKAVTVSPHRTLDRAVKAAAAKASPGDIVLLSPACASFDQFRNFEHRGDEFVRFVRRLPG